MLRRMKITEFQHRVYEKTKEIPRGRVTTYKEIAVAIGRPDASRAVGNALNKNPFPIEIPCHRVVRSDRLIGGFSKGGAEKTRLLEEEGVVIENGRLNGDILKMDVS
jgi:O-6-methylguanine DNA methyltransferase